MSKKRYMRASLFVVFGDNKYEPKGNVIEQESEILELEFVKKYKDAYIVEQSFNSSMLSVLNYLLFNMGKNNKVFTHQNIRKDISESIKKVGGKGYEDVSIRKAIQSLHEKRILLKTMFNCTYYVNPLLYARVNESERKQLILDLAKDRVLVKSDFKK